MQLHIVASGLHCVCRWASLHGQDYPEEDTAVHKMVMNIGRNPTVNPADAETTVEIHVLHKFTKDFYGQEMFALACGFIRYVSTQVYAKVLFQHSDMQHVPVLLTVD